MKIIIEDTVEQYENLFAIERKIEKIFTGTQ